MCRSEYGPSPTNGVLSLENSTNLEAPARRMRPPLDLPAAVHTGDDGGKGRLQLRAVLGSGVLPVSTAHLGDLYACSPGASTYFGMRQGTRRRRFHTAVTIPRIALRY